MKAKVLENKRIKEEKLLASALELFSTHEIKDITIQEIVDKAGVAKGTFYLYFKDKYDIQNTLIHKESAKLFLNANQKVEDMNISDFEDRVIHLVDQVLNSLETNPFILRFIKRNLSTGLFQTQMDAVFSPNQHKLLDQFKNGAQASGYHFDDIESIFYIIIEMVGSTCYSSITYQQPRPIQEFKPQLFFCIRAILRQGKIQG